LQFAVKQLLRVATLHLETVMPEKNEELTKNYKVRVVTYIWCGGDVNSQIKKSLLLSLSVNFFKSLSIWQSYQKNAVFSSTTPLKDNVSSRDNHVFFLVTLPNIQPFIKKIH